MGRRAGAHQRHIPAGCLHRSGAGRFDTYAYAYAYNNCNCDPDGNCHSDSNCDSDTDAHTCSKDESDAASSAYPAAAPIAIYENETHCSIRIL